MLCYKKFDQFVKENPKLFVDARDARANYDKYLFHLIEIEDFYNPEIPMRHRTIDDILNLSPQFICEAKVITPISDEEDFKNICENSEDDLVILRGFLEKWGFDEKVFILDYVVENHPNLKIDIIEQPNDFYGFDSNFHERKQTTIKEYANYVKTRENALKSNKKPKNSSNTIKYGVNIELDGIPKMKEELEKKFHPLLVFGSEYDLLVYLRQQILGMTIPQLYIKTRGVWTGGHQENLGFKSINISHGPDGSLWFGVDRKDEETFRKLVNDLYHMDIHSKEGHWFPDIYFFMKHKINVCYTVQQAGDTVIVAPGCLHWVRALGHSLNTSWNYGPKNLNQIEAAMDRYEINKIIKFRSIVPMLTLILDLLNYEMNQLDFNTFYYCANILVEAIYKDTDKLDNFKRYNEEKLNGQIGFRLEPEVI